MQLAQQVGLDGDATRKVLQEGQFEQAVLRDSQVNARSTSGVPFFSFNGEPAFSGKHDSSSGLVLEPHPLPSAGAHDPETFLEVLHIRSVIANCSG